MKLLCCAALLLYTAHLAAAVVGVSTGLSAVSFAESALGARGLLGHECVRFPTAAHEGLREAVAMSLDCPPEDFSAWHVRDAEARLIEARPRKLRRLFTAQGKRSKGSDRLQDAYHTFITTYVAPQVAAWYGDLDSLFVQSLPSLRVSVPGKVTGQRHRDRGYGHQPGQLNFWLPLCEARGSSVLFVEDYPPSLDGSKRDRRASAVPLEGTFGDMHRFYGNGAYHFTKPNEESTTHSAVPKLSCQFHAIDAIATRLTGRFLHRRVSLDFRCVPGPLYDDDFEGSRDQKTGTQRFFAGGYYAEATRHGDAWSIT